MCFVLLTTINFTCLFPAAVEKAVQTRLDHEKMEAELDRRQKDISEQWNCLKEEAKFLDIRTLQVCYSSFIQVSTEVNSPQIVVNYL